MAGGDGGRTGHLAPFSVPLGVTLLGRTLVLFPHFAFGKQVSATGKLHSR